MGFFLPIYRLSLSVSEKMATMAFIEEI